MHYYQVDAFTDKPFLGNPAAVILVDNFPKTERCQEIAAFLNLSQTAFLKRLTDDHFHIRWFSPKDEAPICGHATLASSFVLWHKKIVKNPIIEFTSLAGKLIVKKEMNHQVTMIFPTKPITPCPLPKNLTDALNIDLNDILNTYHDETICVVKLKDEQTVLELKPKLSIVKTLPYRAICITAKADLHKEYDFVSRYFAPRVGILEDPVCGSAHCRLTPYWKNELKKDHLMAKQLSKRTGLLNVKEEDNQVFLTSNACIVLEGDLFL
ncbi:MAG: putative isomerase YddE [Holosporales bacterium]